MVTTRRKPYLVSFLTDAKRVEVLRVQAKALRHLEGGRPSVSSVIREAIDQYLWVHAKEREEFLRWKKSLTPVRKRKRRRLGKGRKRGT